MEYVLRLLQVIASLFIVFMPRLLRLCAQPSRWHQDGLLLTTGESLSILFQELGPVGVKIGQLLSVRRDLLPEAIIHSFRDLQDKVRPAAPHLMKRFLEDKYGPDFNKTFVDFEWAPVATGSIAHVYRARLAGSHELIAVKVKRPDIDRIVERDLRIIGWLATAMQKLSVMNGIPLMQSIEFIDNSIRGQLDFAQEQYRLGAFYRLFYGNAKLRIPVVIDCHCRDSVIVMSFESGLEKIDSIGINQQVYEDVMLTLLRTLYRMIFTFGMIHCDLHPGNVFVNPHYQLVILDFGMTAQLPDHDRILFRNFFLAISHNQASQCAKIIKVASLSIGPEFDDEKFDAEIQQLINNVHGLKAEDFRVAEFIYLLFDIQRRHRISGTPAFTMALISLIQFEGLALHRFPALDFQKEVRLFFTSGIIESVRRLRLSS